MIDVLTKNMKDICDEAQSAITARKSERLLQAHSKATTMLLDACSGFFYHVPDNSGLVMPPLRLGVDDEVKHKCKTVITNIMLRLPKFEDAEIEQVTRALGGLLVRCFVLSTT